MLGYVVLNAVFAAVTLIVFAWLMAGIYRALAPRAPAERIAAAPMRTERPPIAARAKPRPQG